MPKNKQLSLIAGVKYFGKVKMCSTFMQYNINQKSERIINLYYCNVKLIGYNISWYSDKLKNLPQI